MFDYLALFQEYLTVELGLAKNTQLAYLRDLRLLMKCLQLKADEELLQVSRQQLIAYLVRLKQEGRAASTVARKLASIKAFYRFLTAERYIRRNPAEVLEASSRGLHLPKVLGLWLGIMSDDITIRIHNTYSPHRFDVLNGLAKE